MKEEEVKFWANTAAKESTDINEAKMDLVKSVSRL
jgi:hypothetical protein